MKCYGSTAVSKTASSGSTPGTPATRTQSGFMVIVVQWKRREDVALERGVRFSSITPRAHGEIGTLAGQRPIPGLHVRVLLRAPRSTHIET